MSVSSLCLPYMLPVSSLQYWLRKMVVCFGLFLAGARIDGFQAVPLDSVPGVGRGLDGDLDGFWVDGGDGGDARNWIEESVEREGGVEWVEW